MIIEKCDDLQEFISKKLMKEHEKLLALENENKALNIKIKYIKMILKDLDDINIRDKQIEYDLNEYEMKEIENSLKIKEQTKHTINLLIKFTKK